MSNKFRLVISVVLLLAFVLAGFSGATAAENTNNATRSDGLCCIDCHWLTLCDLRVDHEERIYLEDHVFGYNEYLDTFFSNGVLFVDVLSLVSDSPRIKADSDGALFPVSVLVVQYIPGFASDETGNSVNIGCMFGNHEGPIARLKDEIVTVHLGGGSHGGVYCMITRTVEAVCLTCYAWIFQYEFWWQLCSLC